MKVKKTLVSLLAGSYVHECHRTRRRLEYPWGRKEFADIVLKRHLFSCMTFCHFLLFLVSKHEKAKDFHEAFAHAIIKLKLLINFRYS